MSTIRGKSLSHILAFLRAHLVVNRIMKTIDLKRFKLYQERYKDADSPPHGYSKYLDIKFFLLHDLSYFHLLNLHKSPPLRILDLGTGPGYFPYICMLYGHKVVAIDLDSVPMYNELCQFFHVDRRTWKIVKFQNLPDFGIRFDLVTAFAIKFNKHLQPDLWGEDEWRFMLEDLKYNQMAKNGRIFLSFNANRDGTIFNNSLFKLFLYFGGKVHSNLVDIGGPKPNPALDFLDRMLSVK